MGGGGFDFAGDFFGDIVDTAADVSSIVTDLGTEFITPETLGVAGAACGVPGADVFSLGGFDVVGSFAGDAGWFDAFGGGDIVKSATDVAGSVFNESGITFPGVGDLNFGGLPGISDFKSAVSTVSTVAKTLQPVVATAGALGIPIPGAQYLGAIQTGTRALSAAESGFSKLGGVFDGGIKNPFATPQVIDSTNARDVATGLPINTPREVDPFAGINILSDAGTRDLLKNIDPRLISGFVDPGLPSNINAGSYILNAEDLNNLKTNIESQIATGQSNLNESFANLKIAEAELDDPNISTERRAYLEGYVQDVYSNVAQQQQTLDQNRSSLEELQKNIDSEVALYDAATNSAVTSPGGVNPNTFGVQQDIFREVYNPATGRWSVLNQTTGQTVLDNLTQQAATLAAQNYSVGAPAIDLITQAAGVNPAGTPFSAADAEAARIAEGFSPTLPPTGATATDQSNIQNLVQQARQQQAARAVKQNQATASDWRVRLRLAPNSDYLYNDPSPGILAPLSTRSGTDGIIFPYTPQIDTAYKANYDTYDLTHSNYRGYFYKNSYVDAINVRATFTAQDTVEANYLLAVIHFFRSVTKMFYGQDPQRGAPPPLVYLSGYGDYQFNEHSCLVSQFNYNLPADVDYIRAYSRLDNGENLLTKRNRRTIPGNPLAYSLDRLLNNKLTKGAETQRAPLESNLAIKAPTYVPTKIEMQITLLPVQTRKQASQQFSVKNFANGNQLRAGFW
jgi:hypothetical protein